MLCVCSECQFVHHQQCRLRQHCRLRPGSDSTIFRLLWKKSCSLSGLVSLFSPSVCGLCSHAACADLCEILVNRKTESDTQITLFPNCKEWQFLVITKNYWSKINCYFVDCRSAVIINKFWQCSSPILTYATWPLYKFQINFLFLWSSLNFGLSPSVWSSRHNKKPFCNQHNSCIIF